MAGERIFKIKALKLLHNKFLYTHSLYFYAFLSFDALGAIFNDSSTCTTLNFTKLADEDFSFHFFFLLA